MAKSKVRQEACELYVEQEIEAGLKEGKTPYSIGKEISDWIGKLFEVKVPPKTIESRAYRDQKKITSNEVNQFKTLDNKGSIECEQCGTLHGMAVSCPDCFHTNKETLERERKLNFKSRESTPRPNAGRPTKHTFNETNENIDWAKWSWNPVTGCKHGCTYCYARDIANRFYPEKFEPTFRPERLNAPKDTNIPSHRLNEDGIKNVFVCSMADLFGDWVEPEWIEKVLESCTNNPQWNFIFLTKNPKRYLEFKMPDNSWIGATGDTQIRVDEALKIFGQSNHPVKFISAEPLLENIKVGPEINWLIIGGQSKSSNCPAFQPPLRWIGNLLQQVDRYKIDVYLKPNLQIVKKYPNEI